MRNLEVHGCAGITAGLGVLVLGAFFAHGPALGFAGVGHGERSRSQVVFRFAGTESILILAVNLLAVDFLQLTVPSFILLYIYSVKSVSYTLHSVRKRLPHAI